MDPDVEQRFARTEATLDRMSSIMLELIQDHHQTGKTMMTLIGLVEKLQAPVAENTKQIAENTKQIAENSRQIADLREAIRLSLERPPKDGLV